MLDAIGVGSIEELFDRQIPAAVRLGRPLDLPAGHGRAGRLRAPARAGARATVGRGRDHASSAPGCTTTTSRRSIDMLMGRSEFLTPYTPYQPEVSQGGLQVMFEYQTAISELTALPVSNASVYEGPSAVASAGYLARLANGRARFVASAGLHPHSLDTLRTYAHGFGAEVVEVPLRGRRHRPRRLGRRDRRRHERRVRPAAELLRRRRGRRRAGRRRQGRPPGAVVVGAYDPIALGILKPPGECGVDVCVGEGQPLGNRLDFGGPSFGFFAATEAYLRRMPGRIAGETTRRRRAAAASC